MQRCPLTRSHALGGDAEILAGLSGLREGAPGWAELITSLALGLLLAGLIGFLARAFQTRTETSTLADAIQTASALPEPDRVIAYMCLLQSITDRVAPGPEPWLDRARITFGVETAVFEAAGPALYRPGTAIDPALLERSLWRIARRAKN